MKRIEVHDPRARLHAPTKWMEEDIITPGQILEKSDCDVSSRAA